MKLEVDTQPPAGAGLAVTTVDRFGPLRIQHHDQASLFSGKLAAILAREYSKGRDYYDLMWYLSREPSVAPNLTLLGGALRQTAPESAEAAVADWRTALKDKLEDVDWEDVRRDITPFLEQARDVDLLAPGTFEQLLG